MTFPILSHICADHVDEKDFYTPTIVSDTFTMVNQGIVGKELGAISEALQ